MALTSDQIKKLNEAYNAKRDPNVYKNDAANFAYAQKNGWTPPGTTTPTGGAPVAPAPIIKRDGSAFATLANNNTSKWDNQNFFLAAAKDIIQKRQGQNEDIRNQGDYWRTLSRDTSPFGGARSSEANVTGSFDNKGFREMSPSDQASIRASRDAAAGAHLEGLDKEINYRGTQVSDTINSLRGVFQDQNAAAEKERTQKIDAARETRDAELDRLTKLGLIKDLGYNPNAEEIFGSHVDNKELRVGDRRGGSAAWRNNNPGNIKYSINGKITGFAQRLLDAGVAIKEGSAATDGGTFISFPDEQSGSDAMSQLLSSSGYSGLTLDAAMKRWSSNGYGAEIVGIGKNTPMSTILQYPELLNQVITAMRAREGWKEGEIVRVEEEAIDNGRSPAALQALSLDLRKAGLTKENGTEYTSQELGKMSSDDLDQLQYEAATKEIDKLSQDFPTAISMKFGVDSNFVAQTMTAIASGMSDEELKIRFSKLSPPVNIELLKEIKEFLEDKEDY